MTNSSTTNLNTSTTIVFIDAGVENFQQLMEGVLPTAEVFVLKGTADGIEQISEVLQQRQNIDTVHIISHGSPGCLYLGNSQLSLETLNHYTPQLQQWNVTNFLLYGCNVAAGDAGAEFIAKLHGLTKAEIAASKTLTGNAAKGGNWNLEVTTNQAVATLAVEAATLANYPGILVSFVPGQSFGIETNGVSLGDVNGDQILDAFTTSGQGNVVWIGDGNGGFFQQQYLGSPTNGVSLGDVNGDQKLDAVTTSDYYANQVWIGDGNGGFFQQQSFGHGTNGVSLGDVNGDQILDAVTTSEFYGNQLWLGDGNGSFSIQLYFGSPTNGVSLGDVNGDQILDAVTNSVDYGNQVWIGDGHEGFYNIQQDFGYGTNGVSLGDVNGDQILDAVTTSEFYGNQLWIGDGNGGFSIQLYFGSPTTNGVSLGDVNGDQKLDAVTTSEYYGNQVWLNDSNSAPTDLSLNPNSINENVPVNSTVGTLSTLDPDQADTHTYSLPSGVTDNSAFAIDGNKLLLKASADFETKSTYNIRVVTTDAGGLTYEELLEVTINDLNEAPTALALSGNTVAENAKGAVIGSLTVTDPDQLNAQFRNNTLTVSDARFEVVNGQLKLKADQSLDYETLSNGQLTVTVTATDSSLPAGSNSVSQDFTLNGTDVNEAPTALALSGNTVAENAKGAVIGSLTVTDPDTLNAQFRNNTLTVSDTRFEVVNGQLKLKADQSLDYETLPNAQLTVTVTATDSSLPTGSNSISQDFTLNVTDVDESSTSGTPNNDILRGTASADQINGLGGSDNLYGNAGNDTIDGGDGNDIVYGGDDNDLLRGGAGSDRLYGDAGNDELLGGEGDDILYGGGGDDLLTGGAGSDRLYGDGGNDTFVLAQGMGQDLIQGFQDNLDKIRLDGGLTFEALKITQSGTSTLIKVAATGETLGSLVNTSSSLITSADFITAVVTPPPPPPSGLPQFPPYEYYDPRQYIL